MLAISFSFFAGKYHATTWGKHVNEGDVEWPPSQFRILRAIISTWLRTTNYSEEEMGDIIEQMFESPSYSIPRSTTTHKRHYMPQNKGKNTLVFDTFLAFGDNAKIIVSFPNANLDKKQTSILDDVLRNMNYLGRSESWVSACVVESSDLIVNAHPLEGDLKDEEDIVKLLCIKENNKSDIFEKDKNGNYIHPLFTQSPQLKKDKYIYPRMTHFVEYAVPEDRFTTNCEYQKNNDSNETVHYAKYLIDSPVLPNKKSSVDIAEIVRNSLMKIHKEPSDIFSGRDAEGVSLKRDHEHAFYLPYDEDNDGKLDHLIVFSKAGFDTEHQKSLSGLRKLYGYPLKRELNLMMLGMGNCDDLNGTNVSMVLDSSCKWCSFTPFLLKRHPKTKRTGEWKTESIEDVNIVAPGNLGYYPNKEHLLWDYGINPEDTSIIQKDGAVSQLLRYLDQLGIRKPVSITPMPGNRDSRWIEFKRYRRGKNKPVSSIPYGFELKFDEEVTGPIALGYGSHQGLGTFISRK